MRTIDECRVLEIGNGPYFKSLLPDQTTLLWTGRKAPQLQPGSYTDCTPSALWRAMREVRNGAYDVVVAYPSLPDPWHPVHWGRSWLKAPLHPYRAITRLFGVTLLRFAHFPVPFAVIDVSDDFRIEKNNLFLLDKADRYYKRELPVDNWLVLHGSGHPRLPTHRIRDNARWIKRIAKLRPIHLLEIPHVPETGRSAEKRTDVFFAGRINGNSTLRDGAIAELRALAEDGVNVDIAENGLPQAEFYRRMSEAWLTWSPSGRGWDCYRHYEAAQCLSVPVMNYPTILRRAPLEENVHGFYYAPEPGGLRRTISRALRDKGRLTEMAQAARSHVLRFHTPRALCMSVLEEMIGRAAETNLTDPAIGTR